MRALQHSQHACRPLGARRACVPSHRRLSRPIWNYLDCLEPPQRSTASRRTTHALSLSAPRPLGPQLQSLRYDKTSGYCRMSAAPLSGPSRGCQIGLSSRLPGCALPRRLATHIGSQATRRSRCVAVAAAANEEVRRSAPRSGARRTLRSRWSALARAGRISSPAAPLLPPPRSRTPPMTLWHATRARCAACRCGAARWALAGCC